MKSGASKELKGPVRAAFDVLCRVFSGGYADILLDAELKRLPPAAGSVSGAGPRSRRPQAV